jgi:hypothetical protein
MGGLGIYILWLRFGFGGASLRGSLLSLSLRLGFAGLRNTRFGCGGLRSSHVVVGEVWNIYRLDGEDDLCCFAGFGVRKGLEGRG